MCFASAGAKLENMNQQAVQLQQDVDLYGKGETNGGTVKALLYLRLFASM